MIVYIYITIQSDAGHILSTERLLVLNFEFFLYEYKKIMKKNVAFLFLQ